MLGPLRHAVGFLLSRFTAVYDLHSAWLLLCWCAAPRAHSVTCSLPRYGTLAVCLPLVGNGLGQLGW